MSFKQHLHNNRSSRMKSNIKNETIFSKDEEALQIIKTFTN